MNPNDFAEHEASLELRKLLKEGGISKDKKLTPEEQWYRDFNQQDKGTRGLVDLANQRELRLDNETSTRESTAPEAVSRSEENLRNMLAEQQPSAFSGLGSRENSLTEMFRLPEVSTLERDRSDAYLDQYRKLMTPPAAVNTDFASSPLGVAAQDPLRGINPVPGLGPIGSAGQRNLLGPQLGSINPVFSPRAPMDTTEQVLNQWNKFYTPPPVEPVRNYAPPRPAFTAPRREF